MKLFLSSLFSLSLSAVSFICTGALPCQAEAKLVLDETTLSETVLRRDRGYHDSQEWSQKSTVSASSKQPNILAQVTSDGTVNTQVDRDGNVVEITGGEARGDNLFHSFGDFSVPTGNEAFFNNADSISNIFSRVTGGNISNIDGAIRANGSASLFLINPAGIIFGENARLDIGGSFYSSSASSILFEDGEFNAVDNLQEPVLTINAPIGLGFRDEPGDIINRSTTNNGRGLEVNPGNHLSLLGGNVNFAGGMATAPGGTINLGGLSTAGEISFNADNRLSFNDEFAKSNVFLSNNAKVNITADGGGLISVNANNLELTEESLFIAKIDPGSGTENATAGTVEVNAETLNFDNNSAIDVSSFGRGDAGTVNVNAQAISVDGEWSGIYSNLGLNRIATNEPVSSAVGKGGEININTNTLSLTNGARISANSAAQGNAGNINLSATGLVSFSGSGQTAIPAFSDNPVLSGASSQVQFEGNGNGGLINLEGDSLQLGDGGGILVDNDAVGDSGNIQIEVRGNFLTLPGFTLIQSRVENQGNAGNININANSYESNGLQIIAENAGIGDSGNINIDVAETISIDAESVIQTGVKESGVGEAGDITINASSFSANDSSRVIATAEGQGNAGEISITTDELISLDNQSLISNEVAIGTMDDGGDISLVGGELNLSNGSQIIANTTGQSENTIDFSNAGDINFDIAGDINLDRGNKIQSQVEEGAVGNAGNITITAGGSFVSTNDNLILSGSEGSGDGGNIQITVGNSIEMTDNSFTIANNGGQDLGNAGNITLNAGNRISINESAVLSQILNEAKGNAGDINIVANAIEINNFSIVSANAQAGSSGEAGDINLEAVNTNIDTGSVVDASTENSSDGGNINFNGDNLNIVSGGIVTTSTSSDGNAGNINIDLSGDINIDGEGATPRPEEVFDLLEELLNELQESTGLFAISSETSMGNSGNINVNNSENIAIRNNADISVDSQGGSNGGILTINASSLSLDNRGRVTASTGFGQGGSVDLKIDDDIILQNNSLISAQAFNDANGGNLTIDTNFIIAFPDRIAGRGSDIVASAVDGTGGNINITAESLFGIEEGANAEENSTNNIDASSRFSLDGNITIDAPINNIIQGTIELPSKVIEPGETTAQVCQDNWAAVAKNRFTITGKGGIIASPDLPLSSQNIFINREANSTSSLPQAIETSQGKIQPARGIEVTKSGDLVLTAYRTDNSQERPAEGKVNCGA